MSLFSSLFGGKSKRFLIHDRVLISSAEKFKQLSSLTGPRPIIIITWFEETKDQLSAYLQNLSVSHEVILASELHRPIAADKDVYFAEHYPLHAVEEKLYTLLQLKEVIVYNSLDEALFSHFGGGTIISLMQKLGMADDEVIEHKLVSSSIENAQNKIAKKVDYEQKARNQTDWFTKNYREE